MNDLEGRAPGRRQESVEQPLISEADSSCDVDVEAHAGQDLPVAAHPEDAPPCNEAYNQQPNEAPQRSDFTNRQSQNIMLNPYGPAIHAAMIPCSLPPPPPPLEGHPSLAMAQYYQAQMRDHAAAYASAAAGAAWAAAQVAQAAADFAATGNVSSTPNAASPHPQSHHWTTYRMPNPPPLFHPHHQATAPQPYAFYHGYSQPTYADHGDRGHAQHYYNDAAGHGDSRHRRKRQQRQPPGQAPSPRIPRVVGHDVTSSAGTQQQTSIPRGKVRRRFDADNNSSSSGSSFLHHRTYHTKKKKARSDESLIGKSAISALYEWCSKRQKTPNFIQKDETLTSSNKEGHSESEDAPIGQGGEAGFEFAVFLDDEPGLEIGWGRGATKGAAKQMAARRALQTLHPGAVFDEATGILLSLHLSTQHQSGLGVESETEDLAPNLEKRLAIGRADEDEDTEKAGDAGSSRKKRSNDSASTKNKRTFEIYPGTSTTSEDEDENTYYTSRGASVCSALLHAMIQIDSRILEPPQFSYRVSTEHHSSGKQHPAHRGPFVCTARLRLLNTATGDDAREVTGENNGGVHHDPSYTDKNEPKNEPKTSAEEMLEASSVGSTKREARHVASARLLALLFPECNTMVEVKNAAEAARELYAATKALKHQSISGTSDRVKSNDMITSKPDTRKRRDRFLNDLIGNNGDPPLPADLLDELECILSMQHRFPMSGFKHDSEVRRLSRRKQLDAQVDHALQALNDKDEEGRLLPEKLTADDVGRTILRRANEDDIPRVKKLFSSLEGSLAPFSLRGPLSVLVDDVTQECIEDHLSATESNQFWLSNTIVLLLCRAIAAYEDPPLGCAVLTLGFSVEEGRLLRVAQIATEPHLPQERFLECLQDFATCMKHKLDVYPPVQRHEHYLPAADIRNLVESYVVQNQHSQTPDSSERGKVSHFRTGSRISSPLQSVQEESEEGDDTSSVEKRIAKRASKPSKRTRVV